MRIAEILKSSLATLRMNGRRTFLTMFGIIIGIASVITILSLGNGFKQKTLDELAKDEKGRPSQQFYFNVTSMDVNFDKLKPFNDEILDELKQLNGVDEVKMSSEEREAVTMSQVTYLNKEAQFLPVQTADKTEYSIIMGRNLNDSDSKSVKRYAMIDNVAAMTLFETFDDVLHKPIKINEHTYTVVGIYQSLMSPKEMEEMAMYGVGASDKPQIVIPKHTDEVLNPNMQIDFGITVYFKPDVNVEGLSKQIGEVLKDKGPERTNGTYGFFDTSEMMKQIGEQLNMITYFISAVAGISLFIAGVGVMNMMYISVSERTKEIGIRRSMGATQGSVQWQFLLEGISITTIGGLIGYGLGVAIAIIAGNFLPFKAIIDVPTALISVGISVGIGVVFSVFPARAAARKNLVEILR